MSRKGHKPLSTPATWRGPWDIAFYETADGEQPAATWLDSFPVNVRRWLISVITAVGQRPPPMFPTGGNVWQVMRGDMGGLYEARDEHGGWLYRVFCVLDRDRQTRPTLVIVSGGKKPVRREMEDWIYAEARGYRDDYLATRRIGSGSWPPPHGR